MREGGILVVAVVVGCSGECSWVAVVDGCGDGEGLMACLDDCSCGDASVRGVAESGGAPSCSCLRLMMSHACPTHPLW